jgi:hypothetical protein
MATGRLGALKHHTPSFLAEHCTEHEGAREADRKNKSSDQKEHRD